MIGLICIDYGTLYLISDEYKNNTIIPEIKKKKPQTKELVSALCEIPLTRNSSFTGTANSFELLGLTSRHGIGGIGSGGQSTRTMDRS